MYGRTWLVDLYFFDSLSDRNYEDLMKEIYNLILDFGDRIKGLVAIYDARNIPLKSASPPVFPIK